LSQAIGLDPPPLPVAWTNEADRALAASLIPAGHPVIGLGPTANWAGKVWPGERFVALFRAVSEARLQGAGVAVFAGPGPEERRLAEPVLAALPGAIDLVGRLSLPEAAACLARCALFIGNDSGLMHLSAAAGAPTLGLFGPSAAAEYAPAGSRTAIAVAPGPVGRAPISALLVDDALQAALALLDRVAQEQAA
jgi:ADP-heptose:LPS heptosyltransferase